MMGTSHTLHKHEKLSHKSTVDAIFQKKGKSIFKPPLLLAYYKTDLLTTYQCQLLVSVGKRKFKLAVHRNRIKRQLTDIYRQQKHRIYDVIPPDDKYAIGILFLGKTTPTYEELEQHLTAAIDELIKRIR